MSDTTNSPILYAENKTVWDSQGYVDDSALKNPLISGLLGVYELMESVYETDFGLMSPEVATLIGQFAEEEDSDLEECIGGGGWLTQRPKIRSEDELRRLAISLGTIERPEIGSDY